MVVRLHGAGVRTLIVHVHVLDHDAILCRCVDQDDHTRVYGPLVISSIEDGAAVQPGYPGDPVIYGTPTRYKGKDGRGGREMGEREQKKKDGTAS